MKPTLLVMAAGMGSRYGGLKQLDPIGPSGELIIDYSVHDALRAGFRKVVFVIRPEIEAEFRDTVGSRFETLVPVAYVYQTLDACAGEFTPPAERTKPWGTAQAVLVARAVINEPFAVINADDFYGAGAFRALADFLTSGQGTDSHALIGYMLRDTLSAHGHVARGICKVDAESRLLEVVEHKQIEIAGDGAKYVAADGSELLLIGDEVVSMNLWGFQPSIFEWLAEHFASFLAERAGDLKAELYIGDVVNGLLTTGQAEVQVLKAQAEWFGVTYREDKAGAVEMIRRMVDQGSYPERLFP